MLHFLLLEKIGEAFKLYYNISWSMTNLRGTFYNLQSQLPHDFNHGLEGRVSARFAKDLPQFEWNPRIHIECHSCEANPLIFQVTSTDEDIHRLRWLSHTARPTSTEKGMRKTNKNALQSQRLKPMGFLATRSSEKAKFNR
jgi:hypothetical protein